MASHESNLRNLADCIEKMESCQNTLNVLSKLRNISELNGYTGNINTWLGIPNFSLICNLINDAPILLRTLIESATIDNSTLFNSDDFKSQLSFIGALCDVSNICNYCNIPDSTRYGSLLVDRKSVNITVGQWIITGNTATLPNQLTAGYYDNINTLITSLRWFYDTFCDVYSIKLAINQINPVSLNYIADFIWKYVKGHATCYIPKDKITEDINKKLDDDEFLYTEELRSNKLDMFTGFHGMYYEIRNNHKNPIIEYIKYIK